MTVTASSAVALGLSSTGGRRGGCATAVMHADYGRLIMAVVLAILGLVLAAQGASALSAEP